MKGKFGVIALLLSSIVFAAPVSTPNTLNDTPIISGGGSGGGGGGSGGSGTCRRVDLTNATSDYDLQPCEEAIIRFTNRSSVPLRIATGNDRLYEIFLQFSVYLTSGYVFLHPNNTTYGSSFSQTSYLWQSGGNHSWSTNMGSDSAFRLFLDTPHSYIILDTTRRILRGFTGFEWGETHVAYGIFASRWHSNLVSWTSLGTFALPAAMSGYILVRRLI
jgi:hypothetical protein